MGVTIDELAIADEPAAWRAVGLTVDGDTCVVGEVRIRLLGRGAGRGLLGWSLRGIGDGGPASGEALDLDGLSSRLSLRPAPPSPAPPHPLGVTALDHVVAISPDLDRSVAVLRGAGLELRRIREEPTPAGAPRQAFFRLGATILEVVQEPPEVAERAAARGDAADGPAGERPAFFWGLAFAVPDLDAAAARLGEAVSGPRDAVQPGRRIATLRRSAGLALPVALITPR